MSEYHTEDCKANSKDMEYCNGAKCCKATIERLKANLKTARAEAFRDAAMIVRAFCHKRGNSTNTVCRMHKESALRLEAFAESAENA